MKTIWTYRQLKSGDWTETPTLNASYMSLLCVICVAAVFTLTVFTIVCLLDTIETAHRKDTIRPPFPPHPHRETILLYPTITANYLGQIGTEFAPVPQLAVT